MSTTTGALDLATPRDLSKLLSCTLALQQRWFGVFFSVTALVNVPFVIGVDGVWNREFDNPVHPHGATAAQIVSLTAGVFVLPAVITALHVRIVQGLAEGAEPSVGRAFRLALTALGPAVLAVVLYVLGFLIGCLLFVVPGIIVWVSWYFAAQAAVVEGKKGPAALARSADLVRGRWWPVAGRLLAIGVVTTVLVALPAAAARGITHDGFATVTIRAILGTIALSISALFGTLLFFSLRAEKAPQFPRRDP